MREVWNSIRDSLNTRSIRLPGEDVLLSTAICVCACDQSFVPGQNLPKLSKTTIIARANKSHLVQEKSPELIQIVQFSDNLLPRHCDILTGLYLCLAGRDTIITVSMHHQPTVCTCKQGEVSSQYSAVYYL